MWRRPLKRASRIVSIQILAEPLKRTLPCQPGRRVIVARRGVVVEAVVGALVNEPLVRHVRSRECGIKIRPSRGYARVKLAILRKERRLDLGSGCHVRGANPCASILAADAMAGGLAAARQGSP